MLLEELREQIVEAGIKLLEGHLVYLSSGNISARDPETGLIAVKPTGADYTKMTAEDVVVIDEDGHVVEGKGKPSSETPMHTFAYRQRGDIHAAIHTHSPAATAWSVAQREIPPVVLGQVLTGPIPIAPYCQPGTRRLGEVAMESMGEGRAVILQNHGPFVVGPTVKTALAVAFVVEEAAMVALYASQLSQELRLMTRNDFEQARSGGSKG